MAFCCALLAAAFAVPEGAAESVNLTIEKTGRALSDTEQALDAGRRAQAELDAQVTESKQEVLRVRRELVHAAAEAQDLETRVSALEDHLQALEIERTDKRQALSRRRSELTRTLGALQRIGRTPPDLLIFMPASIQDISRSRLLLGAVAGQLDARTDALGDQLRGLVRLGDDILAQRKLIDIEAERLEAQRARLGVLLARKTQALDRAEVQHSRAEALVADLAFEAGTLQELLDRLVNQEERNERLRREREAEARKMARQQVIAPSVNASVEIEPPRSGESGGAPEQVVALAEPEPASEAQIDAGGEGVQVAALTPMRPPVRPPVSAAEGAFAMPARGDVVSRFDETTALGLSTKGIVIETRASAQIVAPYDGRVAFASPFREYGLLLIIDHGEGYHTLLAGMGRIDVLLDQRVLAGEPVGVMGSIADKNPRLYVELRRHGHPINPLPWLAAETLKVSG